MKKIILLFTILAFTFSSLQSQNADLGQIHGNFQMDAQLYNNDSLIGANVPSEKMGLNSYANFNYTRGKFNAGIRYEGYFPALNGFDAKNNGVGIPYKYASYTSEDLTVTVGNFYEQFGNGLVLRVYEDKALDYDYALEGVKLNYKPYKGVYIKAVYGKQRYYWNTGTGLVRGIDGEFAINDIIEKLADKKTKLTLGGSFVSKYQADKDPIYKLPENVGASAARINLYRGKFSLTGEYAYKINDPSGVNDKIYKPGEALIVNATYSQKGLGIYASAKRVDNMSFQSDRNADGKDLNINSLPDITKTHSYALLAMYPYAIQPNGEIGFQAEVIYKIKKKSLLGGKYGTTIDVNYSRVHNIQETQINDTIAIGESGSLGYNSNFFEFSKEVFFSDLNIEISRKFNKKVKATVVYQNLVFNNSVFNNGNYHKTIYSDVAIADITYKFTSRKALRTEMQWLRTNQDKGEWGMLMLEYSMPHWFFSVWDMYNYGNPEENKQVHYYYGAVGYINKANRIQIGYGRQREGVICAGGVCRYVPASNGLSVSITSSF